jgi:hypothetical protein
VIGDQYITSGKRQLRSRLRGEVSGRVTEENENPTKGNSSLSTVHLSLSMGKRMTIEQDRRSRLWDSEDRHQHQPSSCSDESSFGNPKDSAVPCVEGPTEAEDYVLTAIVR